MRPLDDINLKIIEELQEDARMSVAEIARRLNRSEATIRERMAYLEQRKVIRGYRPDIDLEMLGMEAQAMVRASADLRELPRITQALKGIPNVVAASVLSGDRPIRIRIVAKDVRDLETVLRERIAPLGLEQIDTRIVLQDIVPNRPASVSIAHDLPGDGLEARVPLDANGAQRTMTPISAIRSLDEDPASTPFL